MEEMTIFIDEDTLMENEITEVENTEELEAAYEDERI